MHARARLIVCALVPALIAAACGTAVYPRFGGTTDRSPALPPTVPPTANPGPDVSTTHSRMTVRQVCRNLAAPGGWVVTHYLEGGDECPRREGDSGYNVAVIERLVDHAGGIMTICADQGVPRSWRRDPRTAPSHECPGARVPADQPTSVVIRRR